MTRFEWAYRLFIMFEHPLHQYIRRTLRRINPPLLLDVGGRRSNYTIGLPAVWVTDVARRSQVQYDLDLGSTDGIRSAVMSRRSNVVDYRYDDMTRTELPAEYFSAVSAVEVLEHVDEDEKFVSNVVKVLKPGGHFVMSTPNGDFRPVPYRDHKRHYRAVDLEALLRRHFRQVRVEYRVGVRLVNLGWRLGPAGIWAYGLSALLERLGLLGKGPSGKLHLVAVCVK